jgi:hypothetical protein
MHALKGCVRRCCRLGIVGLWALAFTVPAFAQTEKVVEAAARGQIVSQNLCSATEVCQETQLTGVATHIGRISGLLSERVDLTTGTYSGTAVFTTPDQSTIATEYTGNVTPPDQTGRVFFFEQHDVVGGTGRFAGADGTLDVAGTGDAAGAFQIVGVGTLSN